MQPVYVVDTPKGVYGCDTAVEVAQLRARFPSAQARQVRANPASREYLAGVRAARLALAGARRNPAAALAHLPLHETYRIHGHRVRRVDEEHVVVDGRRMSMAGASRKVGAG